MRHTRLIEQEVRKYSEPLMTLNEIGLKQMKK